MSSRLLRQMVAVLIGAIALVSISTSGVAAGVTAGDTELGFCSGLGGLFTKVCTVATGQGAACDSGGDYVTAWCNTVLG